MLILLWLKRSTKYLEQTSQRSPSSSWKKPKRGISQKRKTGSNSFIASPRNSYFAHKRYSFPSWPRDSPIRVRLQSDDRRPCDTMASSLSYTTRCRKDHAMPNTFVPPRNAIQASPVDRAFIAMATLVLPKGFPAPIQNATRSLIAMPTPPEISYSSTSPPYYTERINKNNKEEKNPP